ncbi:winged helix-turn-helix domain-containing protein [Candidatus Woesearchaeota archaeon]|nr:winged helix-turn-helix domain-containing protein [Candidatus Woesearchaeota archaeon]
MRKSELVYRELLRGFVEEKTAVFTQLELARRLGISLSTVNNALLPLRKMAAVRVKRRNFEVANAKKLLYYWASVRNLERDVVYKTRVEIKGTVAEIEKGMPPNVVFAAYTAYKLTFKDVPADYSEVYVYGDNEGLKEVMKRFPQKNNNPNLFVLRKDFADKEMPLAQMFVDLWNMKEWYAKDFVKALEEKMHGILA